MNRVLVCLALGGAVLLGQLSAEDKSDEDYKIQLDVIHSGFDGVYCWVHARAGIVPAPDGPPAVVLTLQKLWLKGSDIFEPLHEMRTDDLGRTWSGPHAHADSLGERNEAKNVVMPSDFWPTWHRRSNKLLGTGHTVRYAKDDDEKKLIRGGSLGRQTSYSVYDPIKRTWAPWSVLEMPDSVKFLNAGAGCAQRFDLPDGDILLPIYFRPTGQTEMLCTVLRCSFDGTTLRVEEIGNELTISCGRGLYEPSITQLGGRFYLTMRNDSAGYVATSDDGLHFGPPRLWTWDDGTELGNYNTQQHWVTHNDKLYLVYTRKGANNDHVFRHRAPLFIAQVDRERLVVIRATERILIPERGARLGNFGVTEVSPTETWVTVAEWMQTWGEDPVIPVNNPRGANNSVYAARIQWNTPSTTAVDR